MIGNIIPDTDWEKARRGKFTSSEASVLLGEGKSGEELSKGAKTYIHTKVSELLTGTVRVMELYSTDWGNTYEPMAIEALKVLYPEIEYFGNENKKFFVLGDFSGGSPDAVCKNITFEVKCPENPANHIEFLLIDNEVELKKRNKDYWVQIQMNMMCVAKERGLKFKDMKGIFVSFCPIMLHPHNKMKIIHLSPDLEFEGLLMERIEISENYMADVVKKLIPKEEKLTGFATSESGVSNNDSSVSTKAYPGTFTAEEPKEDKVQLKSIPPLAPEEKKVKAREKLQNMKPLKSKLQLKFEATE